MLWQAKKSASGSYTTMKTPSSYKISWEDVDSNSYRNITNGSLVRSRLSSKWYSGSFTFNYLTEKESETLLNMINAYPLYIKVKSPLFGTNGWVELECYVSKVSADMRMNNGADNKSDWQSVSFNIIQGQVINGQ